MFDVNTAHTLARWQHQQPDVKPGRTSTEREFEDLDLWARQAGQQARTLARTSATSRPLFNRSGNGSLPSVIAQLKQRVRTAH